jgi:hypothetical protein
VTIDIATQAKDLVRIVRDDSHLPAKVRREAGAIASLASSNPDLAIDRLEALRLSTLPALPLSTPTLDYARCVSLEVFWRFNLDPAVKRLFVTAEDYRRWIESRPLPEHQLKKDLGAQLLAPSANSWLVPVALLDGLSASELKIRLNFGQPPPYVLMVLSVATMTAAGVEVRSPTGVDAIPSRHTQWFRENVPDERIDRDIPRAALERIEWRT